MKEYSHQLSLLCGMVGSSQQQQQQQYQELYQHVGTLLTELVSMHCRLLAEQTLHAVTSQEHAAPSSVWNHSFIGRQQPYDPNNRLAQLKL